MIRSIATTSTKTVNILLSTASFFARITDKFLASFEGTKNASKANEILYFFDNFAILNINKFSPFNKPVGNVKTIDDIDQLLDEKAVLAYRNQWLEEHKSRQLEQNLFTTEKREEQQDVYRGSSGKRPPRHNVEKNYNYLSNCSSRQINQL